MSGWDFLIYAIGCMVAIRSLFAFMAVYHQEQLSARRTELQAEIDEVVAQAEAAAEEANESAA